MYEPNMCVFKHHRHSDSGKAAGIVSNPSKNVVFSVIKGLEMKRLL